MKTRISKATLKRIASEQFRDHEIVDTELKGFGIRIRSTGATSYFFRYSRPSDGKIDRISLGPTTILSPEEARERARELRAFVIVGKDPKVEISVKTKSEMTIMDLWTDYLKKHLEPKTKPKTINVVTSLWRKNVLELWKNRTVTSIKRSDCIDLLDAIESDSVANRLKDTLSKAFNLAEIWEIRPDGSNPFRLIKGRKEKHRERMLKPDEVRSVLISCEKLDRVFHGTSTLVRLILLTGARHGELRNAKLADIDREKKELILHDSKTGAGKITLVNKAIELIDQVRRNRSEYLIPGDNGEMRLKNPWKGWKVICEDAKLKDLHLHDLRHVFGTYAHHFGGASKKSLMELLRHEDYKTTDRYIQGLDDETRTAAEKTTDFILDLKRPIESEPAKPSED